MLYSEPVFPYNEPIETEQQKETKHARFSPRHDGKVCRQAERHHQAWRQQSQSSNA